MTAERFLSFTLAAALLIAVPGPSVLFIVGRALALGRRSALITAVGNAGGVLVLAATVTVGLGPLLQRFETLLLIVKVAGAAYLIALGVRAVRSARHLAGPETSSLASITMGTPLHTLREGFLVGLMNPKALVFLSAVLPQFVDPTAGHLPTQLVLLATLFITIGLIFDVVWGMTAGSARTWFSRDGRRLRATTRAGGVVMIGLGGGLLLEATRD